MAMDWVDVLGTNTGASGGFPATGMPYRIRGASIGELGHDRKITANRDYWNLAAYLMEVSLLQVPQA